MNNLALQSLVATFAAYETLVDECAARRRHPQWRPTRIARLVARSRE
ncbi:MAG: hypothetical protein M3235_13675 [Actinomycetota bacterium]|nr:hypothetical protein [Actinomycetota bacterium]